MKILRNTMLRKLKNTWRQGTRREAGAVILSSKCHLICMLEQNTLHMGIGGGSKGSLRRWEGGPGISQGWGVSISNISLFRLTSP